MPTVFLSYARADGKAAATRLRAELERAGFQIWRDIEDMQGGQAWKDQLRAALRSVDVIVVVLTPAAVDSKYVEWEWENALTLEKRVIPLLMAPCNAPEELKRLHYHNLSTEQDYVLGFASLTRDLNLIIVAQKNAQIMEKPTQPNNTGEQSIAVIGNADNNNFVTGDGNTVGSNNSIVNQLGKYGIKIDKAENMQIGDNYNE